jgi:hypothetical protein
MYPKLIFAQNEECRPNKKIKGQKNNKTFQS